jgi:hypothetical protein
MLRRRKRVKEHLLSEGDRAALQALVPLAGALGAGTIFALFFGGRRRAGFAVFELFTIVAVLTAVGSTAISASRCCTRTKQSPEMT